MVPLKSIVENHFLPLHRSGGLPEIHGIPRCYSALQALPPWWCDILMHLVSLYRFSSYKNTSYIKLRAHPTLV